MTERHKNHLEGQTSPYLIQHLYNPVDWYPWSEAAFEKAKREQKLLLISIGYSSCHWCHVMEKESFEDDAVADIMNRNFVCIKVDREERPDIDTIYMRAVQLLSGQGGWPLNCFALPDGKPFWGGTYFPKKNWKALLQDIADLYRREPGKITDQAERLTRGLHATEKYDNIKKHDISENYKEYLNQIVNSVSAELDPVHGGLHGAPKFPMPCVTLFLLNLFHHTQDRQLLDYILLTLKHMAMGGIYDQVGGGFARYSTDMFWKVPHFEKMLYDNAQLVSLYCFAWQTTREPLFREVVYETLEFIHREMTLPEGVFCCALDADSEGVEGRYYVWQAEELDRILGSRAGMIKKYFCVEDQGNWEDGINILFRKYPAKVFADRQGLALDDLESAIQQAKAALLAERQKRKSPLLDDKSLVSWNSLMIKAYADAFAAFGEEKFRRRAETALNRIIEKCIPPDGELRRVYKAGRASVKGFLDDYAFLIEACISVYQVTANQAYLLQAKALCDDAVKHFYDPGSGFFFFSSRKGEKLVASNIDIHDNVLPSACSVMAGNLFYLGTLFGSESMLEMSRNMLDNILSRKELYGSRVSNWASLLLHRVYGFYSVAVCGSQALAGALALLKNRAPNRFAAAAAEASSLPVFKDRFVPGKTCFYVCRDNTCMMPVETAQEAEKQMGQRADGARE